MTDVLLIGGGPAGVSAALYAARAGAAVTLLYKDCGALAKAERIENFYGQPVPPGGAELAQTGLEQARRLGVAVTKAEAVGLGLADDVFTVETAAAGVHKAKAVILATGAARVAPDLPGLAAYEGRGVSYCAVCDGFFYRGKDVAVLGAGDYARHEAEVLRPLVKSVTLLAPDEAAEVIGGDTLTAVKRKDGGELAVAGLFVAVGTAGGIDLAKKLGAEVTAAGLVVDGGLQTTIPGLWAAGDCIPGVKQIAKAVCDGMTAAMAAVQYLQKRKEF